MSREIFESADAIEISNVGDDGCRIRTTQAELVLSYDAIYDLALRLSSFLKAVDENDGPSESLVH